MADTDVQNQNLRIVKLPSNKNCHLIKPGYDTWFGLSSVWPTSIDQIKYLPRKSLPSWLCWFSSGPVWFNSYSNVRWRTRKKMCWNCSLDSPLHPSTKKNLTKTHIWVSCSSASQFLLYRYLTPTLWKSLATLSGEDWTRTMTVSSCDRFTLVTLLQEQEDIKILNTSN